PARDPGLFSNAVDLDDDGHQQFQLYRASDARLPAMAPLCFVEGTGGPPFARPGHRFLFWVLVFFYQTNPLPPAGIFSVERPCLAGAGATVVAFAMGGGHSLHRVSRRRHLSR